MYTCMCIKSTTHTHARIQIAYINVCKLPKYLTERESGRSPHNSITQPPKSQIVVLGVTPDIHSPRSALAFIKACRTFQTNVTFQNLDPGGAAGVEDAINSIIPSESQTRKGSLDMSSTPASCRAACQNFSNVSAIGKCRPMQHVHALARVAQASKYLLAKQRRMRKLSPFRRQTKEA
jgi:hypothetical protein